MYVLVEMLSPPTTDGGMQNSSLVRTCTHCVRVFARLCADVYAGSVLIIKIFASGAHLEV